MVITATTPPDVGKFYLVKGDEDTYFVCQSIMAFRGAGLEANIAGAVNSLFGGTTTMSLEIPATSPAGSDWNALQMFLQMRPPPR